LVAVAPCPPSARPSQTAISRSDELTKASFADLLVLAEILELREEETRPAHPGDIHTVLKRVTHPPGQTRRAAATHHWTTDKITGRLSLLAFGCDYAVGRDGVVRLGP